MIISNSTVILKVTSRLGECQENTRRTPSISLSIYIVTYGIFEDG
jgi:hypothetical protein